MSLKLIEDEARRFLMTDTPEVVCIRGRWGVGKTFAWHRYVKASEGSTALRHYSYVSLFGVNSLEEFKYALFENSVPSDNIDIDLKAFRSDTVAAGTHFGKKALSFLKRVPKAKDFLEVIGPYWFLSVKDTVICVDDIERRGKNLSIRDVLGVVSNLKERKGCKICLILNAEALNQDKEDFDTYFEKVIDTSLTFEPTPHESVAIALTGTTLTQQLVAECCIKLGLSNIRLIKKIERAAVRLQELLKGYDEQVIRQAVVSLALFGWIIYDPSRAPSMEFLTKRRLDLIGQRRKEIPPKEAEWIALLDAYGFGHVDEFDSVLFNGMRDGYFDPALVAKYATPVDARAKAAKVTATFREAWRIYREEFSDNQETVLKMLDAGFREAVAYISPSELDATVTTFKQLGRGQQALELVAYYVDHQPADKTVFDLTRYTFGTQVSDPDIIKAFNNRCASLQSPIDPEKVLLDIAGKRGWNPEELGILATASEDQYYEVFKKHSGHDLRMLVDTCLQFGRFDNPTAPMREIAKRAKAALIRIGRESPINALRVRSGYGIQVDAPEPGNNAAEQAPAASE